MLDHVLVLLAHSENHRRFDVEMITRCIMPPLKLAQHTGIVEDGRLMAWGSWAFMKPDKAEVFLDGRMKIAAHEWNEGETLVMMDFVAPFGHAMQLQRKMRDLFPGQVGRWIRHSKRKRVEVRNVK